MNPKILTLRRTGGVVPATFALAEAMATRLSPEHVREVREVSGLDPAAALALSLWSSVEAYAYVPPDSTAAVFMMGVEERSALSGLAMVWMLGTAETARHPVAVLRAARRGIARAFAVTGADCLEQYVPEWYRTGLRFVERLGFSVDRRPYLAWSGAILRRVFIFREGVPGMFSLSRKEAAWVP